MKEYFIVRINYEDDGTLFNDRKEMNKGVSSLLNSSANIRKLIISKLDINTTFKEVK